MNEPEYSSEEYTLTETQCEERCAELRSQLAHVAFCFEPETCPICPKIREAIDDAHSEPVANVQAPDGQVEFKK